VALSCALLGFSLTVATHASAADPNVQSCLDASDASLELETQGKLLSTRSALRACAASSCPQEIRAECARRLELIEPQIPRILCEVRDPGGRLRTDARLTIDGSQPAISTDGTIELDPGAHTLLAEVQGKTSATRNIVAELGERNRLIVVTLEAPAVSLAPRAAAEAPPWPVRRTVAVGVAGAGLVSLGVATAFTFVALNKKEDAESVCPANPCSTRAGSEEWRSAWQAGNVSTGFAIGGAVALGVAAGLWFSVDARATALGVGPGQLQVKARF
jgi:hypothetical protein